MTKVSSKRQFPEDIKLKNPPLAEAWLDIRWKLTPGDQPQLLRDPVFPFVLGEFYAGVRNEFRYRKDLPANAAPLDMLPYIVRHQFRPGEEQWPILQLGPGVATVNFTNPYTWSLFKENALYLRSKLVAAYRLQDTELEVQSVALQYRNALPFQYSTGELFNFLKKNLNTSITLPAHLPGSFGSTTVPIGANANFVFNLVDPKGQGTIGLATATKKDKAPDTGQEVDTDIVVVDLTVTSTEKDAPDLVDERAFASWLASAHTVIHEWFLSLIEGPLWEQYMEEED